MIRTIVRLFHTYRPMEFFGMLAAFLLVLAAIFFISVLITYIKTGLVNDVSKQAVAGGKDAVIHVGDKLSFRLWEFFGNFK